MSYIQRNTNLNQSEDFSVFNLYEGSMNLSQGMIGPIPVQQNGLVQVAPRSFHPPIPGGTQRLAPPMQNIRAQGHSYTLPFTQRPAPNNNAAQLFVPAAPRMVDVTHSRGQKPKTTMPSIIPQVPSSLLRNGFSLAPTEISNGEENVPVMKQRLNAGFTTNDENRAVFQTAQMASYSYENCHGQRAFAPTLNRIPQAQYQNVPSFSAVSARQLPVPVPVPVPAPLIIPLIIPALIPVPGDPILYVSPREIFEKPVLYADPALSAFVLKLPDVNAGTEEENRLANEASKCKLTRPSKQAEPITLTLPPRVPPPRAPSPPSPSCPRTMAKRLFRGMPSRPSCPSPKAQHPLLKLTIPTGPTKLSLSCLVVSPIFPGPPNYELEPYADPDLAQIELPVFDHKYRPQPQLPFPVLLEALFGLDARVSDPPVYYVGEDEIIKRRIMQ